VTNFHAQRTHGIVHDFFLVGAKEKKIAVFCTCASQNLRNGAVVASVKEVTRSVGGVENAVSGLSSRIDKLDGKHDDLSEKVHRHLGRHEAELDLEED
jgi:hypothetical protein